MSARGAGVRAPGGGRRPCARRGTLGERSVNGSLPRTWLLCSALGRPATWAVGITLAYARGRTELGVSSGGHGALIESLPLGLWRAHLGGSPPHTSAGALGSGYGSRFPSRVAHRHRRSRGCIRDSGPRNLPGTMSGTLRTRKRPDAPRRPGKSWKLGTCYLSHRTAQVVCSGPVVFRRFRGGGAVPGILST
jgi:hypothetical protein